MSISSILSPLLLFLLITGITGSCDAYAIKKQFSKVHAIGFGIACQFVLLPLLGLLAVTLFPQSDVTVVTLIIVTTSPGGGFSGWWCSLANADLALSVAMTTASTLFTVIALPINVFIYIRCIFGTEVDLDFTQLTLSIIVVVAAVLVGFFSASRFPSHRGKLNSTGQAAGALLILLGLFTNTSSKDPIYDNDLTWFLAVGMPCVLGLVLSLSGSRMLSLTNPEAVAVAIECVYQNTGFALTIALSVFPPDKVGAAAGVPLFYGIVELVCIPIFALVAWRLGWTYAQPSILIYEALLGNFQPSEGCAPEADRTRVAPDKPKTSSPLC